MTEPENLTTEDGVGARTGYRRNMPEDLVPRKRNHIVFEITRAATGKKEYHEGWNSRVDAGASWQAGLMGSAAGNPAKYIALSSTVLTPAHGDTTLSGELSTSGMSRAAGTYTYTAPASLGAAASYTIAHLFTATGTVTVNSSALFDASSAGNLFVEANLTVAATLASGDTVTITWTINI